jgi:hypothetical protein
LTRELLTTLPAGLADHVVRGGARAVRSSRARHGAGLAGIRTRVVATEAVDATATVALGVLNTRHSGRQIAHQIRRDVAGRLCLWSQINNNVGPAVGGDVPRCVLRDDIGGNVSVCSGIPGAVATSFAVPPDPGLALPPAPPRPLLPPLPPVATSAAGGGDFSGLLRQASADDASTTTRPTTPSAPDQFKDRHLSSFKTAS